jgi:Ca2+-binding EF-hand superfamily protein
MDTNGDGEVDFDEFAAAMTAADEREEAEAELESLRGLFAALDADGSGRLDDGELRAALKSLGVRLTPEEARYLLAQIDADGDGDISFEEFAAFVMGEFSCVLGRPVKAETS